MSINYGNVDNIVINTEDTLVYAQHKRRLQ
jgi:hypothetical protein